MKGRNAQVSRIYMILNIMEGAPFGLSTREIHNRLIDRGFDVEVRTVYRDLDALRAAGFPLDEKGRTDDNGTRWTLERTTKVTHYLALNSRELLGLYFARNLLTPLKDTPFYQDLQATFEKITEKLAKTSQTYLDELQSEVVFEPGPRWGLGINPDVVDTIRAACSERQVVKISYKRAGSSQAGERQIGPHFLYFAKGSLYLVGEDLDAGVLKTYSVPRIFSAEMTERAYGQDPIDPDQYFATSFGVFRGSQPQKIRLKFNETVAPYVRERRWHGSQSLVALQNGSIDLTFEVGITPDLVQWVLGFGSAVSVIEPAELSKKIVDEAEKILAMYLQNSRAG